MIKAYAAMQPGGQLEPYEYDPGELGADEVEVDVQYCGICHSDLSVIDSEWGKMNYPVVAGHEAVGTISMLGQNVKHLELGQTVGLGWQCGYCDACSSCGSGDHNLCSSTKLTIMGHHGAFADKVRAGANSVVPIPDGIDLQSAGPMFCGGITVFNPLVQYDIKPTDRVGVIGIGGLGHIALKFLNAWGCEVTAFTSSESKREEALSLGAHHVLNSRDSDEIKSARGSFDLIISTVNVKLDWKKFLGTLAPRGRLHFVGVTLEPLEIPVSAIMSKQLSISSSPTGSPATMVKMLEFAKHHDIRPTIEVYKFDDINAAIDRLRSGDARYRVVLER